MRFKGNKRFPIVQGEHHRGGTSRSHAVWHPTPPDHWHAYVMIRKGMQGGGRARQVYVEETTFFLGVFMFEGWAKKDGRQGGGDISAQNRERGNVG